ncbi:hypothetical protein TBK1r_64930 [Stieleria magnilauensis]|uniref:Uncharacterized protein n=1 Tax=Stieleria magnilauensis TaxID=2527963 RepID=A0ABX5XZJ3_9BACT|nr:hypothetical protein TBK1r_64930 [Planctomycetes bacterium TBK1r]
MPNDEVGMEHCEVAMEPCYFFFATTGSAAPKTSH